MAFLLYYSTTEAYDFSFFYSIFSYGISTFSNVCVYYWVTSFILGEVYSVTAIEASYGFY